MCLMEQSQCRLIVADINKVELVVHRTIKSKKPGLLFAWCATLKKAKTMMFLAILNEPVKSGRLCWCWCYMAKQVVWENRYFFGIHLGCEKKMAPIKVNGKLVHDVITAKIRQKKIAEAWYLVLSASFLCVGWGAFYPKYGSDDQKTRT